MGQWLTPENLPGTTQCWQVFVPSGWSAYLFGALNQLTRPENWERYGSVTEEEAANAWMDANAQTFNLVHCSEGGGDMAPIGCLVMFGGLTIPGGWLKCDGAEYNAADYPDLYAVIGNAFGGTSPTTFKVPDMKLNFPRGCNTDGNMGFKGGATSVILDEADCGYQNTTKFQVNYAGTKALTSVPFTAHENLPPFLYVHFLIRAT